MPDSDTQLRKRSTGIRGLDAATKGGLPAAGGTLIAGEAGAGKSVLAMHILANAVERGEGGILVSFEESEPQIRRGAASFAWGRVLMSSKRLAVIDGRPPISTQIAGEFDLEGLMAALGVQAERLDAAWVVLDGVDRLLSLQRDPRAALDRILQLNEWCEQRGLSLLLTGKLTGRRGLAVSDLEGIEFMLSTVLVLSTELVDRRLNRRFRIAKYRGTGHAADQLAMLIDSEGVHLPHHGDADTEDAAPAPTERVGSGIAALDRVLGGGLYRGSTTLVSGKPGTAKTTLAVHFSLAAAMRGERALYISFDEPAERIVRNAASVGMDLNPAIEAARLRVVSREAWRWLVEEHYIRIQRLIDEFDPRFLVIDPISALLKAASAESPHASIERLLGITRRRGITTVLTSLTETNAVDEDATLSHTSTLADNWISLNYNVHAGERNRGLSVVKARGTAHSNQVRELLLGADGVDLADVYEFGSAVLMGTARLQHEREVADRQHALALERERKHRELARRAAEARERMEHARAEVQRLEQEIAEEQRTDRRADEETSEHRLDVVSRRHGARAGDADNGHGPQGDER